MEAKSEFSQPSLQVVCIKKPEIYNLGFKSLSDWVKQKDNVFIGSNSIKYLGTSEQSVFENPFHGRENSIHLFKVYAENNKDLQKEIYKLKGKKYLGCWCQDRKQCHGKVIVELFENMMDKENNSNNNNIINNNNNNNNNNNSFESDKEN